MSTSKLQRYVSQQLSIYFGQYTIRENIRPDWLITPDGARLELDFYIEELRIAIEVQGEQHWRFSPLFHKTKSGYNQQIERDKTKRRTCKLRKIRFIEIFSESDISSLVKEFTYPQLLPGQYSFNPYKQLEKEKQRAIYRQEKIAKKRLTQIDSTIKKLTANNTRHRRNKFRCVAKKLIKQMGKRKATDYIKRIGGNKYLCLLS